MICEHCRGGMLRPDVNGLRECSACGDHPGPLRDADLTALDQPAPETPDELRDRHEARLTEVSPGVRRRVFVCGPEPKRVVPDERDEELARLRTEIAAMRVRLRLAGEP